MKEDHDEIEQAKKLHPTNVKEQGFIAAGAAFYQKKSKMSHAKHTEAYSSALDKLHARFPDDVEVSAFYALRTDGAAHALCNQECGENGSSGRARRDAFDGAHFILLVDKG